MKKIIYENKYFRVIQEKLTQRGTPHKQPIYHIYQKFRLSDDELEEARNIIDPLRNISGKQGIHWKFKKRKDVDRIWTWLVLRWS